MGTESDGGQGVSCSLAAAALLPSRDRDGPWRGRCWLKVRGLPLARDGGLSQTAWLLLAVHAAQCCVPVPPSAQTRGERGGGGKFVGGFR